MYASRFVTSVKLFEMRLVACGLEAEVTEAVYARRLRQALSFFEMQLVVCGLEAERRGVYCEIQCFREIKKALRKLSVFIVCNLLCSGNVVMNGAVFCD